MAVGTISPVAVQHFFDNNGNPLAGGKLFFYLAGTTTPSPAYADVGLMTPLANPVILDAAGRAPELFLAALTYKQVLQNAGGVTIWTADNIVTPAALRSVGTITSVTGPQHDLPVPQGVIGFIDFRNTSPVTVDGFAGGTAGQLLLIRALGSANVNLIHASASASQVGNQLYNFSGSGPTTLVPQSGSATYIYQEGSWILLNHEQGGWIRVPYSAGNFVATSGSGGTWVVDAADIKQMDYRLSGTSVLITVAVEQTSVTGAPIFLVITNFPYTFKTAVNGLTAMAVNNGVYPAEASLMAIQAGTSNIAFERASLAPWSVAANLTHVYAQVQLDVQ